MTGRSVVAAGRSRTIRSKEVRLANQALQQRATLGRVSLYWAGTAVFLVHLIVRIRQHRIDRETWIFNVPAIVLFLFMAILYTRLYVRASKARTPSA